MRVWETRAWVGFVQCMCLLEPLTGMYLITWVKVMERVKPSASSQLLRYSPAPWACSHGVEQRNVNAINEKNITTTVCTHPLKCRDGSGLGLQPGSDVISSAAGPAVTVTANNATRATPHKKTGAITVVSHDKIPNMEKNTKFDRTRKVLVVLGCYKLARIEPRGSLDDGQKGASLRYR